MGDVMDEIRAEAKRRTEAREAQEKRMRSSQAKLSDLDRKPNRANAASSSSSSPPPLGAASALAPAPSASGFGAPSAARPSDGEGASASEGDTATLIDSTEITLPLCGCGGPAGEPVGTQLFGLAGVHPPGEETFAPMFKEWFEEDYFPQMSSKLQKELVSRAKTKGFFSGLSSQVKKLAMANTDARLQAEVWHAYFAQNAPPSFSTYGCVRIATVNLGSVAHPCWTKFWGYPQGERGHWMLSPFAGTNADIGAILDELDGRGGMAALLSAA